jgi:pyruvate kinase
VADLAVVSVAADEVVCECLTDVEMHDSVKRLAVNFASAGALSNGAKPNAGVPSTFAFNARDDAALDEFAAKADADFVSVGFAPDAKTLVAIRATLRERGLPRARLIAQIDTLAALRDLPAVIAEADVILLARGELGSVVAPEKMFAVQKHVLRMCERVGRPCVVTRLMDSMIFAPRPTRAEATDVANAVLDGTDCVMLSGETAAGAYPRESVEIMASICEEAEQCVDNYALSKALLNATMENNSGVPLTTLEALASSTVMTAAKTKATCIVVLAASGEAARVIAKYRPAVPIVVGVVPRTSRKAIGFANREQRGHQVARQLMLTRGLVPKVIRPPANNDDSHEDEAAAPVAAKKCVMAAVRYARRQLLCRPGDKVVAMYNVEKMCAVVRVIEVTEDMLEGSLSSMDSIDIP